MTIIIRISRWLYELKNNIAFKNRKTLRFSKTRILLFNVVIPFNYGRWKKDFLKKLCFVFRSGILCKFWVAYSEHLAGIKQRRYLGFSFSTILKKRLSFLYQHRSRRDSNPNYWWIFSFDISLLFSVKARHALYWISSSFSLNELLKAWWYRTLPLSRCGQMKAMYSIISFVLGNKFQSLRKSLLFC